MTATRFRSRKHVEQLVRRSHAPARDERTRARQEPIGVLVQRALAAPSTLYPDDGERLAETLGNQGMAQLSARAGIESQPNHGDGNAPSPSHIQRTPQHGVIQRTPRGEVIQRNIGSLIEFWENQKKLNAPTGSGGGGKPTQLTAPQVKGGAPVAMSINNSPRSGRTPASTGTGGTHFGSWQGSSVATLSTSNSSGSRDIFQVGGVTGAGVRTPYDTPVLLGSSTFSPTSVEATADRKRRERAGRRNNNTDPLDDLDPDFMAWFFYEGRRHDYRASVDEHYEGEEEDSAKWIFSKVLTSIGSKENFLKLDEDDQREMLGEGLKWAPENVEQFLLDHEMKVKYMNTDEERQELALHLGSSLKQGSSNQPYDTSQMYANAVGMGHSIFVMAPDGQFYAGQHQIGRFHHSTFMAGASVAAAGTLKVDNGTLKHITNKTGHYKSDDDHLRQALMQLKNGGVSLTSVKVTHFNESLGGFEDAPGGAEKFLQPQNQPQLLPFNLSSSVTSSSISTTLSSGVGFGKFSSGVTTEEYELQKLSGGDPDTALQNAGLSRRSGYIGQWFIGSKAVNIDDQVKLLKGEITVDDLR